MYKRQDQSAIINKTAADLTVTSAMKGLAATVKTVLTDIKADKWDNYAGKIDTLGLVSENPEENYVQLPIETTQWSDGFTEDDYKALVKDMFEGKIKVSNDITAVSYTHLIKKQEKAGKEWMEDYLPEAFLQSRRYLEQAEERKKQKKEQNRESNEKRNGAE